MRYDFVKNFSYKFDFVTKKFDFRYCVHFYIVYIFVSFSKITVFNFVDLRLRKVLAAVEKTSTDGFYSQDIFR